MNRQQRRHPVESNPYETAKKILAMKEVLKHTTNNIVEGQRVRLNYEHILNHPDYDNLQIRYKQFVEQYRNEIMTIKFDDRYPDHTIVALVDLKGEEFIWRFHITDLEFLKEDE
jgi:hypothetical protein